MRAFVIGTAGHVDHGKTALVKALTGVDTDRWREEKERGLTIDLGFARLPAGPGRDLEAAVIDVPGHEDFVKNMLAGATGIDVVLLVVAADEGPMPQTREHLVIARLLGVRHGVVALTKVDRVEAEWRDLAAEAVRDELRLVLGHDEWPIVPVSSTAETGLEALRAELLRVSEKLAPRGEDDLFRLPVDRAFAVAGAGTVITGTSWSGTAAVGEEILLLPQGIRARIRSLQMHGQARDVVGPGRRCALALVGVDSAAVSRGTVAVRGPGWLAVSRLGARLTIPGCLERSIEQGQRVRVHLGTREVMARVDLEDTLRPGASGWARLRLEQPLVARTRDRFVLRFYSPISTLGGGIVAELDPPGDWRQRTSRWSGLLETGVEKALEAATELRGGTGLPIDQAPVATGISASELASAAALEGGIVEIGGRWFPAAEVRACREDVLGALSELHRRGRRSRAVSLAALRREAQGARASSLVDHCLDALARDGEIVVEGPRVRLPDHLPALTAEEEKALESMLQAVSGGGLEPPMLSDLEAHVGGDAGLLHDLLDLLVDDGRLVSVSPDLYVTIDAEMRLREKAASVLARVEPAQASDFKEALGVSRRYLIPYLQHLDARQVTRRTPAGRVSGAACQSR